MFFHFNHINYRIIIFQTITAQQRRQVKNYMTMDAMIRPAILQLSVNLGNNTKFDNRFFLFRGTRLALIPRYRATLIISILIGDN